METNSAKTLQNYHYKHYKRGHYKISDITKHHYHNTESLKTVSIPEHFLVFSWMACLYSFLQFPCIKFCGISKQISTDFLEFGNKQGLNSILTFIIYCGSKLVIKCPVLPPLFDLFGVGVYSLRHSVDVISYFDQALAACAPAARAQTDPSLDDPAAWVLPSLAHALLTLTTHDTDASFQCNHLTSMSFRKWDIRSVRNLVICILGPTKWQISQK